MWKNGLSLINHPLKKGFLNLKEAFYHSKNKSALNFTYFPF